MSDTEDAASARDYAALAFYAKTEAFVL